MTESNLRHARRVEYDRADAKKDKSTLIRSDITARGYSATAEYLVFQFWASQMYQSLFMVSGTVDLLFVILIPDQNIFDTYNAHA